MIFINMNVNSYSYYVTRGIMEQTINVQGMDIFVRETGQGVPMLLLHGSPDTGAMWLPLMERLKDKVRAIALDLPGFGGSLLPADFTLTLDHYADFINTLLDKLGIQEPVYLLS